MFSRSILVSCKCRLKLLANKGTMRGCEGTFVDVETWDGILWTRELAQARQTIPWRELTPCHVRIRQTLHQFRKIQATVHKHSASDPKQTRAIWWFSILSKHMEIVWNSNVSCLGPPNAMEPGESPASDAGSIGANRFPFQQLRRLSSAKHLFGWICYSHFFIQASSGLRS